MQLSGDRLGDAPLARGEIVRPDAEPAQMLGSQRSGSALSIRTGKYASTSASG
jgi:hypothetical protein